MSKNWVGAALGASSAPLRESVNHVPSAIKGISPLSRVLGEADLDRPEQGPPPESPDVPPVPAPTEQPGVADLEVPLDSNVQSLAAAWTSGDKMAVAQHVLSGLPSFTDLVSLFYGIGMDGAMELARIMDGMDSGEEEEQPNAEQPVETPYNEQ